MSLGETVSCGSSTYRKIFTHTLCFYYFTWTAYLSEILLQLKFSQNSDVWSYILKFRKVSPNFWKCLSMNNIIYISIYENFRVCN